MLIQNTHFIYGAYYNYFSVNYQVLNHLNLNETIYCEIELAYEHSKGYNLYRISLTNTEWLLAFCYAPVIVTVRQIRKLDWLKVQKSLGAYSKDLTISYNIILLCDNVLWRLMYSCPSFQNKPNSVNGLFSNGIMKRPCGYILNR